jgi:hypothetical protein
MELAQNVSPEKGYVMDYNLEGEVGDYTFRGDTTYLVTGDGFTIDGTATFEGGAVIKNDDSAVGGISVSGYDSQVDFKSRPYNPVIFTSQDDDSVGEIIPDSTGQPQPASVLTDPLDIFNEAIMNEIQNARFCYSEVALHSDAETIVVRDSQFIQCGEAVDGGRPDGYGDVELYNVLFLIAVDRLTFSRQAWFPFLLKT